MTKVIVVNDSGHKYDRAIRDAFQEDVEFITLTEGSVNVFNTDRLRNEMSTKILSNIHYGDVAYVLLCGAIVLNVIACNIIKDFKGNVNVLIYDPRDRRYVRREGI